MLENIRIIFTKIKLKRLQFHPISIFGIDTIGTVKLNTSQNKINECE